MRTVRQIRHNDRRVAGLFKIAVLFGTMFLLISFPPAAFAESLLIFAGAASKPPTEEAAALFTRNSGIDVKATFGGSGFVLSQMKLARRGDIYFPGSSDFMEKAKREKLVLPETEKVVAYLIPAINVPKGNPQRIRFLRDLLKPGLRLAIAEPESVCVGTYAVEVIEKNLTPDERKLFRKNLATTVESCEKTANVISLKAVDAVLGWEVFQFWDPKRIETVLLNPAEIPRIGYLPVAVSKFARDRNRAEKFVQFLASPESKAIFKKYGYSMNLDEARKFTLPDTPVGGEYSIPEEWKRQK